MVLEMFEMEDTELEEGEANYKDDMSIDPDISLSYIDEKLQSVLGHFQKDFEGGFSAENLGAKYGGYGSFLPSYERSPSVWSQPKATQQVQIPCSSLPNALPTESAPQSSAAPSDVGRTLRPGTGSRSSQPLHSAKVLSLDALAKQDLSFPSAPVTEKVPQKQEPVPNKPPNSSERRTLKVRIKVGSDKTVRKNAAIYSGLGLISPSSSTGNSIGESGGAPSNCQVSIDDSPNRILQVMTSFPVPGDLMLSPLHESLLCIAKTDRLLESNNSVSSSKSVKEHAIHSNDTLPHLKGNKKVPKEKKLKVEDNGNVVVLKPGIGIDFADNRRTVDKQEDNTEARTMVKERALPSNDMKVKSEPNSACNALDIVEAAVPVSGLPRVTKRTTEKRSQVVKNGIEARLSTGSVKEEYWESSSDQDDDWLEKIGARNHSHESALGSSYVNASNDQKEGDQSKDRKLYGLSKAVTNASKCKINFSGRALDHPKDEESALGSSYMNASNDQKGDGQSKDSQLYGLPKAIANGSKCKINFSGRALDRPKDEESALGSSYMNASNDQKGDDQSKGGKLYGLSNAITNGSKCKINLSGRALNRPKDEVFQTDACQELAEIKMLYGEEKSSFDGKRKSKGSKRTGKPASEADQISMAIVAKDKKKSGKLHSSMSRKDTVKVRHNYKDLFEEKDYSNVKGMDSIRMAAEKDQHTLFDKSKQTSNGRRVDPQLPPMPLEDTANEGYPPKVVVPSEMEPPSVAPVLIEENWVCCDSCGKWRLLPYGSTEKLPDKWLCSMLNWLPGMNHCDISEEETTKALNALYQLQLPESQSNLQSYVGRTSAGALTTGASHFEKNNSSVIPDGVRNPQKKKERSNEKTYGSVKAEHLSEFNEPSLKSGSVSHSNAQKLTKPKTFRGDLNAPKHEEKLIDSGDGKRKISKKRGADQNVHGSTTKKIKAGIASVTNDLQATIGSAETDKIARGSGSSLPTKPTIKCAYTQDGQFYSNDIKSMRMENVQASAMKQVKCASVSPHMVSLGMKRYDEREMSLKKRAVKDWQASQNHAELSHNDDNYLNTSRALLEEESTDREFRKAKKYRLSSTDGRESITNMGGDILNRKGKVPRILISSGRESPGHGMDECRSSQNDRHGKVKKEVASKSAFDGVDPLKRDAGMEQFSRAAASSSSKVSDSRRSRTNNVEVRGSPVESVSSSPMRISKAGNLSPGARDTLAKDPNGDYPGTDRSIRSSGRLGKVESSRAETGSRRKVSNASPLEPALDFREKGASKESAGKPKLRSRSFEVQNTLVNSEANDLEAPYRGNPFASDHRSNEDRMDKNSCHANALYSQESRKDYRQFGNSVERIKVKVSFPPKNKEVLDPKLSQRVEGPGHVTVEQENQGGFRFRNKPVKSQTRVGIEGCTKKRDSDQGRENQLGLAEQDSSAVKSIVQRGKVSRSKASPQQKRINNFEGEVAERSDPIQVVSRAVNSEGCDRAGELEPHAHASHTSDRHASKDIPPNRGASSHVASMVLKDAEKLRDYADRLKDSGFGFECNEAYFQAALKFLHGASLLQTVSNDKYGDMSQMQIYSSTADLCEICASEYEQRQELAAAALAYKCMEVAYMNVVSCKNSTTSRDRHDLQASLQVVPQGESPSSSASDVDNLNQAIGEKVILSKGVGAHTGNHVIVARNRTNFVRLLDFTKDVNSAMEASRKAQNAFAAASGVILKEGQNKEGGISSVKRVLDFSFQDVDELVRLVQHAIEAISRQRFGSS